MSCITQLLEMKGDKPFLKFSPHAVIEGGGNYKDYEYLITFTNLGHRCGYVALKQKDVEKLEKDRDDPDYYYPDLDCHGGITFYSSDHDAKDLLPISCSDHWVGFDCGHYKDKDDKELTIKYFGKSLRNQDHFDFQNNFPEITIKSYEFVEEQCKLIINQLTN